MKRAFCDLCDKPAKLIAAGAILLATSAWGAEVIVEQPAVNGVRTDRYVVYVSEQVSPLAPPGRPVETDGTFETEDGKIYRIVIRIETDETSDPADNLGHLERAIYELQMATGVRP